MNKTGAIGFMDSGVGGLTVLSEAMKRLPRENFVYFGDSKNCPYGNRTADDIYRLSVNMLNFLKEKGVKCVLVACNTISALGDRLNAGFDFPIIRIIDCCAEKISETGLESVGLIATEFTVNSGVYKKRITAKRPSCEVVGVGSKHLARLIETKGPKDPETKAEITACTDKILEKRKVSDIILGCTHYPLAKDAFCAGYPDVNFIDPAQAQCDVLEKLLSENGAFNTQGGRFELYTSGAVADFLPLTDMLGIRRPDISGTVTV